MSKSWIEQIKKKQAEDREKRLQGYREFKVTENDRRIPAKYVWLKKSTDFQCVFKNVHTIINNDGEESTAFFEHAGNRGAFVLVKEV